MNLPFTLLDILERLMPGAIVLGLLLVFTPPYVPAGLKPEVVEGNIVLLGSIFTALSYALGVMFNLLAGISPALDRRLLDCRYADPDLTDPRQVALGTAFKQVFDLELSANSWTLCYGVAENSGYGIRVDLFSSLNMFCRSMLVGMLVLAIAYAATNFPSWQYLGVGFGFLLSALLFGVGARTYSRSFAQAILEAFHTWYRVEKLGPAGTAGGPAA